MYETNSFDVDVHIEQRARFKSLCKKYGAALIVLTVNAYVSSFILVFIVEILSSVTGINFLEEGTDIYYWTAMILNELTAYALPIAVFYVLFKKERQLFIPDRTYKPFFGEAFVFFLGSLTTGALGTIITEAINSVIDSIFGTGEIEEAFAGFEPSNMGQFGIFAFCICIVAPIAEEYIFRDLLLKPLRAFGDKTAIIVTGLVFGLYHGNFDQFAYAVLAGMFYSMIAVKYNSIVPTIILHSLNNTIVTFSGDLTGAIGELGQRAQEICAVISDICSGAVVIMMEFGIASILLLALLKRFRFNNHNIFVPEKESAKIFFTTPVVIAGLIIMLADFFIKL